MKLLQEKWTAGAVALALVVSSVGGCAQPTGSTPSGSSTGAAASSDPSTSEADAGVDVPAPEGAAEEGAKTE